METVIVMLIGFISASLGWWLGTRGMSDNTYYGNLRAIQSKRRQLWAEYADVSRDASHIHLAKIVGRMEGLDMAREILKERHER